MSARPEMAAAHRLQWRIRLLLGCYPPWWRVRYDDEMRDTVLAMRAAGQWSSGSSRDLFHGLVQAWLDPTTTPEENPVNDHTTQLIPRAAWGLLLFVLAGIGFAKVIEDPDFGTAADHHAVLAWSIDVLTLTAIGTAVVMALAALPSLVALLRTRPRADRHTYLLLATVPIGLLMLGLSVVAAKTIADGSDTHMARTVVAFILLVIATLAVGTVITAALVRLATRLPESPAIERSRLVAMIAVGLLTTVAALSVVVWVAAAAVEARHLLHTEDGLLATPTLPSVVVAAAVLVCGAALCATSGAGALVGWRSAANATAATRRGRGGQQPSRRSAK